MSIPAEGDGLREFQGFGKKKKEKIKKEEKCIDCLQSRAHSVCFLDNTQNSFGGLKKAGLKHPRGGGRAGDVGHDMKKNLFPSPLGRRGWIVGVKGLKHSKGPMLGGKK